MLAPFFTKLNDKKSKGFKADYLESNGIGAE
jgi:hypothetical protein